MLDVGTGTWIAAMLGAHNAQHVWATDITERSAHFAEFNRRLAGIENMTAVAGDMYAPVAGLTFDPITIHPPYVPSRQSKMVYRDAGEDGEQILRRAVEGLPQVLRPGGRYYSVQMATDRDGETFEQRVRKWLGDYADEFDVAVAAISIKPPADHFAESIVQNRMGAEEAHDMVELLKSFNVKFLVYGALLIERHASPRKPLSGRIQTGDGFAERHLDWELRWQQRIIEPDVTDWLAACHAEPAPDLTVESKGKIKDGRLAWNEFHIRTQSPFSSSFRCEEWVAHLIAECDGSTWKENYERARYRGLISEKVGLREFSGLLTLLVTLGILRLKEFPVPAAD